MRQLSRRGFLKVSAAGASLFAARGLRAAAIRKDKPNIVFVFADQMRACAMGCMGNEQVITPNLDKLAASGLLVTNAISCQPVCTPFRGHLMTGRYGHATGLIHNDIKLPDSETTIAEVLKDRGYQRGYIGKWHLNGDRRDPIATENRQGWDYWAVRNCSHRHFNPVYWLNNAKKPTTPKGWEPEVQTDLAIDYIKSHKDNPFCLFLSFGPPHNPYKAPQQYLAKYADRKLTNRPNAPGDKTNSLLNYYAMVTSLDDCIGRIVKALDAAGIAEDTVLCFSSDHGDMLGSQGHVLKQRPWAESIDIPFIMRYPRKIKGAQKRDWLVASVDIMPTLLGLAGAAVPKQVQGMDLSATFCGQSKTGRDAAFLFNVHRGGGPGCDWRGIRTKKWVYAYHKFGDWVMYDLENDPYQLRNLIDDPMHAAKKKQLRQQLEAMRKELGENIPLGGKPPAKIRLPG
ncbi:MAG: sulfatase [Phycisphaerae bacterium]|nr:sulfatase [Planctomycetota bacterium]MBL7218706.1 sulfatase [Phycisphaerae bacterium]